MAKLKIQYVPLGELQRWNRNPKQHDLGAIIASIERYGFRDAPIYDETLDAIVAGNGRVTALVAMKEEERPAPDGIVVRKKDGEWLVPVQFGINAESPEVAEAFGVDHNNLTVMGGETGFEDVVRLYDQNALAELLAGRADEFEMPVSFDHQDLDSLIHGLRAVQNEQTGGGGIDAAARYDDAVELAEEMGVKSGQRWELGRHRLLVRNCGEIEDFRDDLLEHLGESIVVLTDPPYSSGGFQESDRAGGTWGKMASDSLSTRGYTALIRSALSPIARDIRSLYVFTDWRMWITLYDVVESTGVGVRSMIVWDKGHPGLGHIWRTQHELILHAADGHTKQRKGVPACGNVLAVPRSGNKHHDTEKPVELLRKILANDAAATGREGAGVYDPFVGSGSTIIAGELEGRTVYSTEVMPEYAAVALQRWIDSGGEKPKLL